MANEASNGTAQADTPNVQGQQANTEPVKESVLTLTQKELDAKIASESDKRVTEALKTREQKLAAEYEAKIKHERQEAERLASLSAEERRKEEEKKRSEELAAKEMEIAKREMKLDAINVLAEKKLPVKFVDFVIGANPESTLKNINELKAAWDHAIEDEIKTRLTGKTPTSGAPGTSTANMNDILRAQLRGRR